MLLNFLFQFWHNSQFRKNTDTTDILCIFLDKCGTNPCLNGGICIEWIFRYLCECVLGFTGQNCETNIDDCPEDNPCQNGGACVDGLNTYWCQCTSGFTGSACSDVDDCPAVNPCQNGGTCVDRDGSYTCNCAADYGGQICNLGELYFKTIPSISV